MSQYVVLLPGDEDAWESLGPEAQAATYARHERFSAELERRGHTVTGGAELAHSRHAKVLRTDAEGRHRVTEGPYAETVEQLSGFYLVASDDLEDLLAVCELLADQPGGIEVRECLGGGGS